MTTSYDPLNTHSYDGKININLLSDIVSIKGLTLEQKRERGVELLEVGKKFNQMAYSFLERIILSMGTSDNIDITNGIVADDLICLCWSYRENNEFMNILETQLIDMRTGFCPQGRTHRLFQSILPFTDGKR